MIEKNTALLAMEAQLNGNNSVEPLDDNDTDDSVAAPEDISEEETALYRQRILTNNDWSSFKYNFEKVFPGYIKRVRQHFPTITEAEERLFLCLKLNLKTHENAAMLGISFDSIKKNRHRLRKRLGLEEGQDLNEFVRGF
ncbi:helix-turn-helix transcriptional regulator [Flavobacterium sp. 3HN19-14]|uniref:helix-turn-helix transcriptional regulator n=1 Tax=Flavobacterium sp. 3HN19-14 TaxID=3448133 RepID=UPI003EE36D4A